MDRRSLLSLLLVGLVAWQIYARVEPEKPTEETVAPRKVQTKLPRPTSARTAARSAPASVPPGEAPAHREASLTRVEGESEDEALEPEVVSAEGLGPALDNTFRDSVIADVQRCLAQTAPAEGFEGKMRFALRLDTSGLQEAAIEDLTGLPDGLTECVAEAVWDANWPAVRDGEVDVTYPVMVSTE